MMTVQELIDELSKVEDKTLGVQVEGCDCINDSKRVDPEHDSLDGRVVLIEADV